VETDTVDLSHSDPAGKRALFTGGAGDEGMAVPTSGAGPRVTVDCRSCGSTTTVSAASAVGLLIPSLHLPLLKRDGFSWMKCPACRRRTWVSLTLHL
jgi:hypothetical protein